MKNKPTILRQTEVAKTRLFRVEELDLEFSNGARRIYERMVSSGSGAVMVVAITSNNELVLIREYSAGTDDYQLAFPKGLVDAGETFVQAGNRELKEETGYGAKEIVEVKSITLAPGYFSHRMTLLLATGLYEEKLAGDEPEPLEVVLWPADQLSSLLEQPDFTEARSIAALLLVERQFLKK
ncbi:MAG: ADP compounds hydrolase NudE [Kangiellaceae bacterium]|nr:ADP compounds hydrolase NudE [Kangiellaceae bacterium]MCW8999191.1 ADP compounds hydrolase NudE [Kangiellaceae bacterium]